MPGVRIVSLIGALLLALALPLGASAAAPAAPAVLQLPVCIAPASPGSTAAEALRGRLPYDCTSTQHRHGPGDYWALSARVPPAAGTGEVRARVLSLWQRALTLHALYADGHVETIPATSATLSRHLQLGAIIEFALPARPAPVTRLLWHVEGASNVRGILLGQRIANPAASQRANLAMAAIYGGFGGLAIALLVYNLAIWAALRHRFQLAYCVMVGAMLAYIFSSSGALAWAWPGIDNNVRLRINYLLLGIIAAAGMAFARFFFEPRVFGARLRRLIRAAIVVLLSVAVLFWPLSYVAMPLADAIYSWSFLAGLALVAPVLWSAWRQRSDYLWMFAVAWAAPIAFSMARVLAALHVVPTSFWLDNSTVLSLGIEALLSSIAIAYRIWMLSRERDEALAGETLARRLADTDPLTGLLNRRAFLSQAIGREGVQQLHVLDIDHFKRINETLGHDGGDEVLRVYARVLRTLVPAGALVARIGGEEFAIVAAADLPIDAERILAKLRSARMPFDLTVTSSIGSCIGPLHDEIDWKRLYHSADRALFDAKSAGRDRARHGRSLAA
ncbi:diguanylate cyclase domain-containing protein [Sphingomonas sp. DT-204]